MSANTAETRSNVRIRREIAARRDPQTGALPKRGWPEWHTLGYDVWNGMTLCYDCACEADCNGQFWNPRHDYFLLGVRSVTTPCRCGNCNDPIVAPSGEGDEYADPTPLCCWCDLPATGVVDEDSPACGEHLRQYGGSYCKGCGDSVCAGQELCAECISCGCGI